MTPTLLTFSRLEGLAILDIIFNTFKLGQILTSEVQNVKIYHHIWYSRLNITSIIFIPMVDNNAEGNNDEKINHMNLPKTYL